MKKTIIASAIAATALTAAATAQAQGFYVYGEGAYNDIASSDAENDIRDQQGAFNQETAELNEVLGSAPAGAIDQNGNPVVGDLVLNQSMDSDDSGDTTFGLGLGYQFNENFAAEFGYRDLGDASYKGSDALTGTNASGSVDRENSYDSEAFILRGVASLPVTEKLSVEGLLGVAYVDTDYSGGTVVQGEGLLPSTSDRYSESDSGFSATYGVGASYAINDALTGYARWERIHDIDTEDAWGGIEADTFSAGVRYHF